LIIYYNWVSVNYIHFIDKIEKISESKVINFTLGLGGWPLLNPSLYFNSNKNTSIDLMHSLFKIGINPLFNVYVTSKPNNPGISMLRVSWKLLGWLNWNEK